MCRNKITVIRLDHDVPSIFEKGVLVTSRFKRFVKPLDWVKKEETCIKYDNEKQTKII